MLTTLFPGSGTPVMAMRPNQNLWTQKVSMNAFSTQPDQLLLSSSKKWAGNRALISKQSHVSSRRSNLSKIQAVLNPFAAARNPISEKDFDKLLSELSPIAPSLRYAE